MASGLQCPGCGHVHPAGLPEIARGDTTFRCYGCYRTLSVPEGWTGRPSARPATPPLSPAGDAPPGAGTRDARRALRRLNGDHAGGHGRNERQRRERSSQGLEKLHGASLVHRRAGLKPPAKPRRGTESAEGEHREPSHQSRP